MFDNLLRHHFEVLTVISDTAIVSPSAVVGVGSVVCPGAIVAAGARIGRNVIVNTGAIVEHDCEVADHVHVASGAILSDNHSEATVAAARAEPPAPKIATRAPASCRRPSSARDTPT